MNNDDPRTPMSKEPRVVVHVEWGYDDHECPLGERAWRDVLNGKPVTRTTRYAYEGDWFNAEWRFNWNGHGSLIVTYDGGGTGFQGSLPDVNIYIDGARVPWWAVASGVPASLGPIRRIDVFPAQVCITA